jgi:hypothetical protein
MRTMMILLKSRACRALKQNGGLGSRLRRRGEQLKLTTPGTDCILMWSDDTLFRVLPDGSVEMRDNGVVSRPMPDKNVRPSDVKKDQPPRLN